ncbi:hypothetical protein NHX12_005829, partial [Muraenolepis orangiensis]
GGQNAREVACWLIFLGKLILHTLLDLTINCCTKKALEVRSREHILKFIKSKLGLGPTRWRLQLSVGKSVAAAYHLSTREARRELQVHVDNKCLEVQQALKYLGVRLDRTLSFKQHLEEVKAKVTSRVALIRRLAGTTWGASAKTLRISTQALVFSAAEYCAPSSRE